MERLIFGILRYNYTEDITGKKKSRLAHLSRTGACKGMFSMLCMHFLIAYQARIRDFSLIIRRGGGLKN